MAHPTSMDQLKAQVFNLPLPPQTAIAGGTYIVTGANTGLGFHAAQHLVNLGAARVILAVRNPAAGAAAVDAIGRPDVAEAWPLDLACYASVRAFAARAAEELGRVDSLISNAAVAGGGRVKEEGHIRELTVNVMGTLLLLVLLFPVIKENARKLGIVPRLAVVTSGLGFDMHDEFQRVWEDPLTGLDKDESQTENMYALSKLLETLAVRHLAELLPLSRTGIVINLINPGLCVTELDRNLSAEGREGLAALQKQFGRTAEDGSRTLLHGATAGVESHGKYLDNCKATEEFVPTWVTDDHGKEWQKRAWEVIAKELESVEPGCVTRIMKD